MTGGRVPSFAPENVNPNATSIGVFTMYNNMYMLRSMSERQKTILSIALATITLLFTAFLWTSSLLLTSLLLVVGVGMFLLDKQKSAFFAYLIAFGFGPLSEAIVIQFGAWAYAQPDLLGFPVWLPFLWGNAGLFLNRLNLHINSSSNNK